MTLIDDNVLPIVLIQPQPILENEIISGETNVPFGSLHDTLDFVSGCWIAPVNDLTNGRGPLFKLVDPVGHCRQWDNNQERAIIFFELDQVGKQGNGLNGLTQPHLIRQNPIQVVIVQRDKPLQSNQLIVFELASFQNGRLLLDLLLHSVCQVVIHVVRCVESSEHVVL